MINTAIRKLYSIKTIKGQASHNDHRNVRLGGLLLQSKKRDVQNLIFFPQLFDYPSNWVSFFANSGILDYRNIYILNPRNIGNSDRTDDMNYLTMAEDVQRFMYQHKISTATLGGHGMGAKIALASACLNSQRTTGYFGIDSSPMDQRWHQPFKELQTIIKNIKKIPLHTINQSKQFINNKIKCPKWRQLFKDRLLDKHSKPEWDFNLEVIQNALINKATQNLGNWPVLAGLWGGQALFTFPQYSRWVHLNTNTLPMYKICLHIKGYGNDIRVINGDQNPLNHWIYDYKEQASSHAHAIKDFIINRDGVHVLLINRSQVGKRDIPDFVNSRPNNPDHYYQNYIPGHYHHNWRYTKAYQKNAQ